MVLAKLKTWVNRLTNKQHNSAPKVHQTKPSLTILEDRLVPAQIIWTGNGTNNLWVNPKNWNLNRVPAMDDQVILASDPTVFDPTSDTAKNTCVLDRVNNIGLPLRVDDYGKAEYNVCVKNLLVGGPNNAFTLIVNNCTLTVLSDSNPVPPDPNSVVGTLDFGKTFLRNNATNYNAGLVEIANGTIELKDHAYLRTPVLVMSPNWAWMNYPSITTNGGLIFSSIYPNTNTTNGPGNWSNLIVGYVSTGNSLAAIPVFTVNDGYHQIVQASPSQNWMSGNTYPNSWPKWDYTNPTNNQYTNYGEIALSPGAQRFEISPATGTLEINQYVVSGKNVFTGGYTNNYTDLTVTNITSKAAGNLNLGSGLGYRPGDNYDKGRDFRLGSLKVDTGLNLRSTSTNNHVVYTRDTQTYNAPVNFLGNALFYFRSFANQKGITGDITFKDRITAQATGTGAKVFANLQVGTFSSCVLATNGTINVATCNPAVIGTFRFNTAVANNIGQLVFENGTYEHDLSKTALIVDQLFTLNNPTYANNTQLTTKSGTTVTGTSQVLIQITKAQPNSSKLFYRLSGTTKVKLLQGTTFPVGTTNYKISYTANASGAPTGGNNVSLYT
jgi:hypothetical protein